jgi:hypothetical protein
VRYLEIIRESNEETDGLMSFWDLAAHFGVDEAASKIHDATLSWINYNSRGRVDKLVNNKKMRLVSKIKLYCTLHGPKNWSQKWTTPEQFKEALSQPVTMWRGGGGTYNPDHAYHSPWVSFTISKDRVATFSKYDGTRAMKTFRLPERDQYWITELTIPLDNILLYLPHGGDEEVIVSADDARKAKVIEQTEPKVGKFPKQSDFASREEYDAAARAWAMRAMNANS